MVSADSMNTPLIPRPVIILSMPRTGSTMLFDAMAQSPDVYTIGGESHFLIESVDSLRASRHDFESSRLTEGDATPEIRRELLVRFHQELRDRSGLRASGPVRMLEKTPRNSLRVPFLNALFPDAAFVFLHRDPRATISSMLEAWRSRRFCSYHDLPGWSGLPWSLLLVPGWRELNGCPLAEIVATQWATAMRVLLDDLESLSPHRWCVTTYDRIVDDPQGEMERLCAFADIRWDRRLTAPLPISRSAVSAPHPEKVERHRDELEMVLPLVAGVAARVAALVSHHLPLDSCHPSARMS
jgi:hypothetical protein